MRVIKKSRVICLINWIDSKIKEASDNANISDFENYTALREMWIERLKAEL